MAGKAMRLQPRTRAFGGVAKAGTGRAIVGGKGGVRASGGRALPLQARDPHRQSVAPVAQAVRAGVGDATLPLPGDHRLQGGGPSRNGFAMHQIAPETTGGELRWEGRRVGKEGVSRWKSR